MYPKQDWGRGTVLTDAAYRQIESELAEARSEYTNLQSNLSTLQAEHAAEVAVYEELICKQLEIIDGLEFLLYGKNTAGANSFS